MAADDNEVDGGLSALLHPEIAISPHERDRESKPRAEGRHALRGSSAALA